MTQKRLSLLIHPLLLSLLIWGFCNQNSIQAQQTYYANTNNTNVRQQPNLKASKVGQLMLGEEVYSLNEATENTTTLTLSGKSVTAPWYKVVTQSGAQGWIFAGLLDEKPPQPVYETWVDNLRMRKAGNLQARQLTLLPIRTEVRFTGQRSKDKQRIQLRNQNKAYYWLEVVTAAGQKGWVYGGGVKAKSATTNNSSNKNPFLEPITDPFMDPSTTPAIDTSSIIASSKAEKLLKWWNGLSAEWRNFYNERVLGKEIENLYMTPTVAEIEQVKSLKELDISNNDECNTGPFYSVPLKDLSGLQGLDELERLYCDYIRFNNLEPLSGLSRLSTLSIHNSTFNSLQGLEELHQLKWLDIAMVGERQLDLAPLSKLFQLEELYLKIDKIKDFEALRSMVNLKKLIIRSEDIEQLSGLGALFQLEHLSIVANRSELSLEPLGRLKKLDYLSLLVNKFTNSAAITRCKSISFLILSGINSEFDMALLAQLPELQELELRCYQLNNPDQLKALGALRALYLGELDDFDFNHLKNCKNLRALEIKARRLQNLKAIDGFDELTRLAILSNGLVSLKELPALPSLIHLQVESDNLTSMEGIARFPKLFTINFADCKSLKTIKEVAELKELMEFYIPYHIPFGDKRVQDIQRPNLELRNAPLGGC